MYLVLSQFYLFNNFGHNVYLLLETMNKVMYIECLFHVWNSKVGPPEWRPIWSDFVRRSDYVGMSDEVGQRSDIVGHSRTMSDKVRQIKFSIWYIF